MDHIEIRAALSALKITQSELAHILTQESAGITVSHSTVCNWCSGKHSIPGGVALALKLMMALDWRAITGRLK